MKNGMFYTAVDGPDRDFAWLREHGFDTVILGLDPVLAAKARGAGFEVWICLGTFAPPNDSPELLCVDWKGNRQKWFNSGCPNEPAIRSASLQNYRRAAELPGVTGVLMDGIRYASPASGCDAFFTCFCGRCRAAAERLGFDADRMARDVADLAGCVSAGRMPFPRAIAGSPAVLLGVLARWPGVADWLAFRARIITAFVQEIAREVHGQKKMLGGYLFSPCLAPLVGQDYAALASCVDLFSPMLYRNAWERNCIAPVNTEIHTVASWCTEEKDPAWALALFGLGAERIRTAGALLRQGLSPAAMRIETARARSLVGPGKPLVPILWHDDPVLGRTVKAVRAGGADGASIFLYGKKVKRILAKGSS